MNKRHLMPTRVVRRATAATELVIVLPLLVVVCLVSVDLGRFGQSYVALANATRVGAEYGATRSFTDFTKATWLTNVRQSIVDEMSTLPHFNQANLTIDIETQDESYDLHRVDVTAQYTFTPLLTWPGTPGQMQLKRSLSMRQFR